MRDSIERIINQGNSSILYELAKRVGNNQPIREKVSSSTPSMNVIEMTMIGKEENRRALQIQDDDDMLNADAETEVIEVEKGACNDVGIDVWNVNMYSALQELIIGNECIRYVKELVLSSLTHLRLVRIGCNSLSASSGGRFEVCGCNALSSLIIGDNSCEKWRCFVIKNCETVNEVCIGDNCFVHCESTVLESRRNVCC